MKNTLVVEQNTVTLDPVMGVDVLSRDSRSLQAVNQISDLLQVSHHFSIWQMNSLDSAGMNLKRKVPSDGILPAHGKDLDVCFVDRRQLRKWELKTIRDHAEAVGAGLGGRHPDVWVRSVFHLCATDKLLVLFAQHVIHSLSRDESGGSERNVHLLTSPIVESKSLASASWNLDSKQRCDLWRVEGIKCSINVPSVESSRCQILHIRNSFLVKLLVVWVDKCDVLQSLVLLVKPIPNDLNLWLMRNRLEVGMEDGSLSIESLAVAVAVGGGVESLGEFVLSFGGETLLVLQDDDVRIVQGVADDLEVCFREVFEVDIIDFDAEVDRRVWVRRRERANFECLDSHCTCDIVGFG